MRFSFIDNDIEIFINNSFYKNIELDKKECVDKLLKKISLKLNKCYNITLKGFYKIKIYPNKFGMFIKMSIIDDELYSDNELEYRVVVIYKEDIYFKYYDYFLFPNKKAYFNNNFYYININDINEEDYIKIVDYGELVLII